MLPSSIALEVAVAVMRLARQGPALSVRPALTFALRALRHGRLLGWEVEKGILSVLFLLASASALMPSGVSIATAVIAPLPAR